MKTHSDERFEAEIVRGRYMIMAKHPEARAEAIANHYTSLFHTAAQMRYLLRHSRYGWDVDATNCIEIMLKQIESAHKTDLGLELTWPLSSYPHRIFETPHPNLLTE